MTAVTGPSFERIHNALLPVSGEPAGRGAWTTFLCPAHDDNQPSAAIKYDPDQHRTVVRCFAGCPDTLVLESLGLSVGDLFDNPVSGTRPHASPLRDGQLRPRRNSSLTTQRKRRSLGKQIGWPVEVAQYVYHDIEGRRIGRVIRTSTEHERGKAKGFYLRRFESLTDTWPLGAFAPVLYRLPQIANALGAGQAIWVCEGEKDVDRAADLGLAATCNALGAGSFTSAHAEQLAGARAVVIVADRDPAGYAHADTVRSLLRPLVGQVLILQARDGKDLSEHLDAGHTLEDLEPCLELGYHGIGGADIGDLIELPSPTADLAAIDSQLQRLLACVDTPESRPSTAESTAAIRRARWGDSTTGLDVHTDTGAEL
ncbi:toprim domain-containing protein [Nocardia jiangxiensis]|uniref:toprim domain-containing protein n=1 Tax=Nocardia jiangxiensis TaxID=282685 RepID=UPI0002DDEA84|nr:toprim domain-containing protein [Nocardia jiangxiensis]